MSIIKNVTLQKIVAHDFRYDPRIIIIIIIIIIITRAFNLNILDVVVYGPQIILQ